MFSKNAILGQKVVRHLVRKVLGLRAHQVLRGLDVIPRHPLPNPVNLKVLYPLLVLMVNTVHHYGRRLNIADIHHHPLENTAIVPHHHQDIEVLHQ